MNDFINNHIVESCDSKKHDMTLKIYNIYIYIHSIAERLLYSFIQISNLFSISNEMQFVKKRLKHLKYTFWIPARV